MDLFGNPAKRDEISPFVCLLWEKGSAYDMMLWVTWGSYFTTYRATPEMKKNT